MYTYSHTQGLESLLALNAAVHGNHPDLTADQSQKNIEDNIVRLGKVKSFEKTSLKGGALTWTTFGSGLQITTDGFIITAAHVIEDWLDDWKRLELNKKDYPQESDWLNYIQDQYAVVYPVNGGIFRFPLDVSFHQYDHHHDVALVKIISGNSPRPILFKHEEVSENYLWVSKKITSLNRNNYELSLVSDSGRIRNASISGKCFDDDGREWYRQDVFNTSIIADGGDSGCPIVSESGSLLGITISAERIEPPPSKKGYAGCAKIKYAFNLAKRAVDEETRKLLQY